MGNSHPYVKPNNKNLSTSDDKMEVDQSKKSPQEILESWANKHLSWQERCNLLGLESTGKTKHRLCDDKVDIVTENISKEDESAFCLNNNWERCVIEKNNYLFVGLLLPKGTPLYHGTYSSVGGNLILERGNFFSNLEAASLYALNKENSSLHKYIVTKPLILIRMDNKDNVILLQKILDNIEDFKNDSSLNDLRSNFKIAFDVQNESNEVVRHSASSIDSTIVSFLCSLGFSGYAALKTRSKMHGNLKFHSEIYICNPKEYLSSEFVTKKVQEFVWIHWGLFKVDRRPVKRLKLPENITTIAQLRKLILESDILEDTINKNFQFQIQDQSTGVLIPFETAEENSTSIEKVIDRKTIQNQIWINPEAVSVAIYQKDSSSNLNVTFVDKIEWNPNLGLDALRIKLQATLGDDRTFLFVKQVGESKFEEIVPETEESITLVDIYEINQIGQVLLFINLNRIFLSLQIFDQLNEIQEPTQYLELADLNESLIDIRSQIKDEIYTGCDFEFLKKPPTSLDFNDSDIIARDIEFDVMLPMILFEKQLCIRFISTEPTMKNGKHESYLEEFGNSDQQKKRQK